MANTTRKQPRVRNAALRDELEGMLLFLGPHSPRSVFLKEALRRLDEGSYGLCEDCGQRIEARRLTALPEAVRCINCQLQYDVSFAA
jgi:hypothetical protein